jgi:hypothetical protein
MFITVLAIICLNLAVPGTCMTEPVVNSNQEQLTMGGCLGLLGFESAKDFWEHHPLYHTWKFKGWACQFGNRAHIAPTMYSFRSLPAAAATGIA